MSDSLRAFSRSLPMALLRAREAVMERFRPLLARHRLSEQQWRVLRALGSVDAVTARALAEMTFISAPSLSRILRNLEHRELIARRRPARDRRTTALSLTPRGAALIDRVGPQSESTYAAIGQEVGRRRLQQLFALLEEVTTGLRGADTGAPVRRRRTPHPTVRSSRRTRRA
ncbi:MAG: homoprotocatechuate degradation operon regulator HpaR [Vicinamibacterales bacterium]